MKEAIEPTFGDGFDAGSGAFHEVLGVEVRSCRVGGAGAKDGGEEFLFVEFGEWCGGGMEAEVVIDGDDLWFVVLGVSWDGDSGAALFVEGVCVRDDCVDGIAAATEVECDECWCGFAAVGLCEWG